MRLADAATPTFARHETFHPHYGWFRKAVSVVVDDGPDVFTRADAPVRIGVGKNMVRAIRFWGQAAKLIEKNPQSPNRRSPEVIRTDFGKRLFGDSGWDQFMEDPGTLWLLHWQLLASPCVLPVWWLAFNEFHAVEFTDDQLEDAVVVQLEGAAEWTIPHRSSIRKDVSVLVRTYATAGQRGRTGIDDSLDCPLRELNLIGRSASADRYRFNVGAKPTLPSEVVAYAAMDYVVRAGARGNTITIGRLTHERGSPGKVFKLTESDMLDALRPAIDAADKVVLTDTTGAIQVSWEGEPDAIATMILDRYFDAPPSDVRGRQGTGLKATASVAGQT